MSLFRKLKLGALIAVIVIGATIIYAGTMGTGFDQLDDSSNDIITSANGVVDTEQNADDLNRTEMEYQIHQYVNEFRRYNNENRLRYSKTLASIARNHSKDMIDREYFAHETPDGITVHDRYAVGHYQCRLSTPDGIIDSGGENIAMTYADAPINAGYTDGTVNHNFNETSIARGIFEQWKNSDRHRDNMLYEHWQNEGIGVAIDESEEDVKIVVTQNFC